MSKHQLNTRESILSFLLAGNAHFTLVSVKTGVHFAFKVKRMKGSWPGKQMYWVDGGANNIGSLTYTESDKSLKFKERSTTRNSNYMLPFKWFLHHMSDAQIELWHEGTCGMCNRPLTDPVSIARGIGPECAAKLATKINVAELFA